LIGNRIGSRERRECSRGEGKGYDAFSAGRPAQAGIPVSRSPKKSFFTIQKRTSSMISVPVGTDDICYAYDIPYGYDIRRWRMKERYKR